MPPSKSSFLDKVLGRIGRLDTHGLQTVVRRLARERSFLETLFNTIEDGVLVVDEDGRILYFNQAVQKLLGGLGTLVEGQPIFRFLPDLDWPKLSELDRAGGQKVVRHEFELSYPRTRFLRMYAAPLDGEGPGRSGLALILHDATEAREKTFEAIESERIHALTLLAASVAHEIGNPLNALHIHLQLIERELKKLKQGAAPASRGGRTLARATKASGSVAGLDAEESLQRMDGFLQVAKGEIDRLDNIITQFLQAIRPTQPQIKMVSVNEVVLDTIELLRPELENRGQSVEQRLDNGLPQVPADRGQIKQVLVNLARNAMQAMTRGGVLTVQTGREADQVWIGISDTGGGIPEEQLNRIFEPYFTTKKKGSGLGLMIVQRIVRDHGGRIELESRVGVGSTFRVLLPLREKQTRLLEARSNA
ncbi:MAG: ATP-binding protein [Verrucomicrobiales bacterium]|nr:ATP-binding protein [Verrucomicrobiales bacterium]